MIPTCKQELSIVVPEGIEGQLCGASPPLIQQLGTGGDALIGLVDSCDKPQVKGEICGRTGI